ncbi:hypothetical protein HAX54_002047, partial [Datura stramonium]|nr:hypothetical protein [Datura stramonium]
ALIKADSPDVDYVLKDDQVHVEEGIDLPIKLSSFCCSGLQIAMTDRLQRSLAAIASFLAPATAQTSNGPPEFIWSTMNTNIICFPSGNSIKDSMELTRRL